MWLATPKQKARAAVERRIRSITRSKPGEERLHATIVDTNCGNAVTAVVTLVDDAPLCLLQAIAPVEPGGRTLVTELWLGWDEMEPTLEGLRDAVAKLKARLDSAPEDEKD